MRALHGPSSFHQTKTVKQNQKKHDSPRRHDHKVIAEEVLEEVGVVDSEVGVVDSEVGAGGSAGEHGVDLAVVGAVVGEAGEGLVQDARAGGEGDLGDLGDLGGGGRFRGAAAWEETGSGFRRGEVR